MGMYTEIFAHLELIEGIEGYGKEWNGIQAIHQGDFDLYSRAELPDHELFDTDRWSILAHMSSFYFPDSTGSSLTVRGSGTHQWSWTFLANLKNYGGEIEKFFDWIDPLVYGFGKEFLGYSRYEEFDTPTLYYKKAR